ncbi:MAG: hypothetical protein WA962_15510 [Ornithinimicrobium sp.]
MPRSARDYPWSIPLQDGRIGPHGLSPADSWSPSASPSWAGTRTPVLAVGSNAAPGVLADKLAGVLTEAIEGQVEIEVCAVSGVAVGHSAHVSPGGYVAAAPLVDAMASGVERIDTLPTGEQTAYSLGWFTAEQLDVLDRTEPSYERVLLPTSVRVVPRWSGVPVDRVAIYRSRHGLLGEHGQALRLCTQREVHRWLAQRLPFLSGRWSATAYADPQLRDRVRCELARRGLVVPSGLS